MTHTKLTTIVIFALVLVAPHLAHAITRAEVITRAQTYAYHPWYCSADNVTGGDHGCPGSYSSVFTVGDHMGLPYDWGGFMTLDYFDRHIDDGYGAGSYSSDGSLACTVGLDCSGYVSSCWDSGHFSTLSIHNTQDEIDQDDMMAGDVYNRRESTWGHVILHSHVQADGLPFLYESVGYGVHATYWEGWSYLDPYTPRRYDDIEGGEPGVITGTATYPIEVVFAPDPGNPDTLVFTHSADTRDSTSDMFDQCAADWDNWENGPEVIYEMVLDSPGRLVATVDCEGSVDIDIHVMEDLNEVDCIARAHETVDTPVDCGIYYLIADSWSGTSGGTAKVGEYDLTVTFTPDGTACGEERGYDVGRPGSPCMFEGNESLAMCAEHLGATTCLVTGDTASDESWCSMECTNNSDCTAEMPGGCCEDIGTGEHFCIIAEYCDGPQPDLGGDSSTPDAGQEVGQDAGQDGSVETPDVPIQPDVESLPDANVDGSSPDQSGTVNDRGGSSSSGQSQSWVDVKTNAGCGCSHVPGSGSSIVFGLIFVLVVVIRRRV